MANRFFRIPIGLVLLTSLYAEPGLTQPTDELKALRKELEALKEGQMTIQKELQEIKSLLRRRQALPETPDLVLSIDRKPFKGDKLAKLTLIEFSDYQCPFCSRHARETLPQIEREYVNTGKVKYVFRDFPLEAIHKEAFKAAEAAHCAGDQGKYWEMHDRLFVNQKALGLTDLSRHAQTLGVDVPTFQQCLESGKHAPEIRKDMADWFQAGIRGTPTFFLGLTEQNDPKVKALRMIRGAQPYPSFKEVIESLLSSPK